MVASQRLTCFCAAAVFRQVPGCVFFTATTACRKTINPSPSCCSRPGRRKRFCACADRVALMKAGRIIAIGPPRDVLTAEALGGLYGVEVAVEFMQQAGRHVCAPILTQPEERRGR